jgi:hypothetical protein
MPVTLAIDPALVEELSLMAAGPYDVGDAEGAGTGTEAAAAFLDRLRAVAAVHPVVALPYGDVDVDSLQAAGLGEVVTRSLPGTPAGTAQDPPASDGDPAPAPSATPSDTTASPAEDEEPTTGAGTEILAGALQVEPRTDLAWSADGTLAPATVTTLQNGGIAQVVLGPDGLTDGERAVGADGGAAVAGATVSTAAGDVEALVADPALSEVAGAAERFPGGPRIAEQRYLAELAVLGRQAPAGPPQTVLVAPARMVDAGLDGAGAMLADTAATPWLRPGTLDDLTAGPGAATGTLPERTGGIPLDGTGLTVLTEAVGARDDLAAAVVGQPGRALREYDAAVARAVSVAWRDDVEGFRAAADDLARAMARLRGRVGLLAPANGTYTLASSDAPLVLTVQNDLPFAVRVLLDVRTRGNRGMDIGNVGEQVLPPQQRTTLEVPTQLRQSGGFAVTAALTTPGGGQLGDQVRMQVRSTAYGWISLAITVGAGLLLGLLFLRRLVRFILRRRAGAEEPAPLQMPPTRSRV